MNGRKYIEGNDFHFPGGWTETLPLSSLPHPNLYLMNQLFGLSGLGAGRRNIYTLDSEKREEGPGAGGRRGPRGRNVTIGYVVAQRGGGRGEKGEGTGELKRICFIYMKVIDHQEYHDYHSLTDYQHHEGGGRGQLGLRV